MRPQRRRSLTGIASLTLAGAVLLAAPPATADQDTGTFGSSAARVGALDIEALVTARKIAMAQDRVDRPWLYR